MKKQMGGFFLTILITLLFLIVGESLIIMYLILAMGLGIISKLGKEQNKEKENKQEEKINTNSNKNPNKVIKPSYSKCKEKVKIKRLERKR